MDQARRGRRPAIGLAVGLAVAGTVSGCTLVGAGIGAGATVGVAAVQDRGISGAARDLRIQTDLNDLWLRQSTELYGDVSSSIYEGRVLLTGTVPTPELRADAVRLAWQVNGVQDVINEINVGKDTSGFGDSARDTWISTELRSKITFDSQISAVNYSITTVHGTVFLMGVGSSPAEVERVANYARNIAYVQRVVSYVRVKPTEAATVPVAAPAGAQAGAQAVPVQ